MYSYVCKECGKQFFNSNKNRVFCSDECRKSFLKREKSKLFKDLTGKKFGRLTPIKAISENGRYKWLCQCDCGNQVWVASAHLSNGHTKSCGCLNRETASKNNNKYFKKYRETAYVENTSLSKIKSNKLPKNNSSSIKGVYFDETTQKWVAKLGFQGKTYRKKFLNKCDAIAYRKQLEEEYHKPILKKYNVQIEEGNNISTCKWCGKEFVQKHYKQVYCSENCKQEAKRKREREAKRDYRFRKNNSIKLTYSPQKCLNCEKEFIPKNSLQKFCSLNCTHVYNARLFYKRHKESLRNRRKEYYMKNIEKYRKYARNRYVGQYYEKLTEETINHRKKYQKKYQKEYRNKNKEKLKAYGIEYRRKKRLEKMRKISNYSNAIYSISQKNIQKLRIRTDTTSIKRVHGNAVFQPFERVGKYVVQNDTKKRKKGTVVWGCLDTETNAIIELTTSQLQYKKNAKPKKPQHTLFQPSQKIGKYIIQKDTKKRYYHQMVWECLDTETNTIVELNTRQLQRIQKKFE